MLVAQVNDTLRVTWQNHTMDLDMVPGVDVASVEAILAPHPDRVNVRWSRCKSRVALLHIYDSLIAIGVPVNPPKADALLAWEELHPPSTLVTPNPDSTELQLGPVSQGARVIILNNGFDPLLKMDNEMYINHIWAICTALRFPLQSFEMAHVAIASELFQRCTADTNPENSGIRPQVFVRSYRYQGLVRPCCSGIRFRSTKCCALYKNSFMSGFHMFHRQWCGIGNCCHITPISPTWVSILTGDRFSPPSGVCCDSQLWVFLWTNWTFPA